MDSLCTEILKGVFSYIQTDEWFPIRHVCRDWYHLITLSLPPRPKPTYKSITSESLLDYYRISTPLSSKSIERIIREVDNYDFYDQYLSHMHIRKADCTALVDDYRYRTVHGLTSIKLMEKYAYKYVSLIPDTIPLIALEHQGTSIKDDRLIPAYGSLMSPSLIDNAMYYGNIPLLKTLCYNSTNIDYGRRAAYMYAHCSYEVIDFMVTNGFIARAHIRYEYSEIALTYMTDNFDAMKQYFDADDYYEMFHSKYMTPELATRFIGLIGHDDMPTGLYCPPQIAHIMEPYLSNCAKIDYYKRGILTPKETLTTINRYNCIDVLEHYGTIYTLKTIPTLLAGNNGPVKKKQPVIERYLNDPVKFIKKYNTLANGWVGTISHPDIYKYIVVRTWGDEYDYTGPITSDLHKLAFHPDIGNPLIGHCPLAGFSMPNRTLTKYERSSLLRMKRVDIITKYSIHFDASHIYEYLKYDLDGAGLPLHPYFTYIDISIPKYDISRVPTSVIDMIKFNINSKYNADTRYYRRSRLNRYCYCTPDELMLLVIGGDDISFYIDTVLWHKVTKETLPILIEHKCYPSKVSDRIKLIDTLNTAVDDSSLVDSIKEIMYHTLDGHQYMILKCNRKLFEISKYFIDRELRRYIENIIYNES